MFAGMGRCSALSSALAVVRQGLDLRSHEICHFIRYGSSSEFGSFRSCVLQRDSRTDQRLKRTLSLGVVCRTSLHHYGAGSSAVLLAAAAQRTKRYDLAAERPAVS
jgi:hypothetical protein